jgi:hypothetical protein
MYHMAVKRSKWPLNVPTFSFPKYIRIWIFGSKIYHSATLSCEADAGAIPTIPAYNNIDTLQTNRL